MNTRNRARLIIPAALALACCFAGCTASEAPDGTGTVEPSPAASSRSASPSASAFEYPDTTEPTQVGIALKYVGDDPSGEVIAGPAALVADRPFTIEGQCEGSGIGFEVVSADGQKRMLAEGDFDCDDPPAGEFAYQLPYAGPVQVNLTGADDAERAWVRVLQP
jgi:hypothetical protein